MLSFVLYPNIHRSLGELLSHCNATESLIGFYLWCWWKIKIKKKENRIWEYLDAYPQQMAIIFIYFVVVVSLFLFDSSHPFNFLCLQDECETVFSFQLLLGYAKITEFCESAKNKRLVTGSILEENHLIHHVSIKSGYDGYAIIPIRCVQFIS